MKTESTPRIGWLRNLPFRGRLSGLGPRNLRPFCSLFPVHSKPGTRLQCSKSNVPLKYLIMLVFTCPDIAKSGLELAIARKSPATYLVIFARAYGMAETRVYAVLNVSTPRSTVPPSSSSGRPLIWLDADLDRRPPHLGPPDGVLAAVRAADSEVIRPTGRTQRMNAKLGGERIALT